MKSTTSMVVNLCPDSEQRDSELTAPLFQLNPLLDDRWPLLIERDPNSTIFHTRDWLRALNQTFGYEPKVFTLSAPDEELQNGIPFCEVRSWLTGRRLVGLPFSDHCDPIGSDAEVARLLQCLPRSLAEERLKYIEIRPLRNVNPAGFNEAEAFHLHMLDLDPDLYDIFQAFHKSSIQRTIRRSERLAVQLSQGSSEWHLETFYGLFVLTRKRLQVPPQPIEWFRNLVSCLGSKLNISIALHENTPIASIITLRHRDVVTYKYGCSDARFHHLGGVSCLFWNAIRHAKLSGAKHFDFGRSDIEDVGLTTFKSRWGATSSRLAYWRCGRVQQHKWESQTMINAVKFGLGKLPATALIGVGRLLYRHIG